MYELSQRGQKNSADKSFHLSILRLRPDQSKTLSFT